MYSPIQVGNDLPHFLGLVTITTHQKDFFVIDLLRIKVPFNDSVVAASPEGDSGLVDLRDCKKRGCKMEAGDFTFLPNDYRLDAENVALAEVSCLRHPFESLPSSWSTLSFKVYQGGSNYYPHIELKASPAKLLTGQNVFGTCNVMTCLDSLVSAFCYALPDMVEIMDFEHATLAQIDCTFTAHLPNESDSRNVIHALRNISNGQTRGSKSSFDTTAYFGKGSRHKRLKAYLKQFELADQIAKITSRYNKTKDPVYKMQLDAMSAPDVQEFATNALRLEASIMPRMLQRLAIPTNVWEFESHAKSFDGCLIKELWNHAWSDIFKTFEGEHMRTYSDTEVHENLREHFKTETKSGFSYSKADRLFRFFRMMKHEGWEEVKATTPKATFHRSIKEITEVVPKAYLQNLQATASNVVPLIRFINVDFERQHPAGWTEPKRLSEQFESGLRLVS